MKQPAGILIVMAMLLVFVFSPLATQESNVPDWPTEAWQTSTPEAQGI